jgi:ribosomal protein S18 acetylase RimI-like enzyme
MSVSIRRLGPDDGHILTFLAENDADFDLQGRGEPQTPLDAAKASAYLTNPGVLHWVAALGTTITGFLFCLHIPLRCSPGHELLLYEIGVHRAWRRRGIGRALILHMQEWMRENGVNDVWVQADNHGAVAFYRAVGFETEDPADSDIAAHVGSVHMLLSR